MFNTAPRLAGAAILVSLGITLPVKLSQQQCREDVLAKVRVESLAISINGFGAGPNQDLQNPLGVRGPELFEWFFATQIWRRMGGLDDGETGAQLFANQTGQYRWKGGFSLSD